MHRSESRLPFVRLAGVVSALTVGGTAALAGAGGEDCNGNGIPDAKDLASGFSEDCQGDLVPDECQVAQADLLYLYDDDIYEGAVGTDFVASLCWMTRFTVEPGAEVINGVELAYGVAPVNFPVHVGVWSDPDGDGDPGDAVLLGSIDTLVQSPWTPVTIISLPFPETVLGDPGDSFFIGVWGDGFPPVPNCFPAPYDMDSTANESWWIEKVGPLDPEDPTAGAALSGRISEILPGVGDWLVRGTFCDTGHCGESEDLDGNGVPDECDPDCNGNGVPDGTDILNGAPDCNLNGIIDTCETLDDCDGNLIPDECQQVSGFLLGDYFSNPDLAGEPISRLDPGILYDFGDAANRPDGIGSENFSVRWTGSITTGVAGDHELGFRHDDGVRLFVDGAPVIDRWGPSGGDLDTAILSFGANETHHLRIEYYQGGGGALLEFLWREPGASELVPVPAAVLAPGVDADGDGVIDVCGVADCDANFVPDVIEIEFGGDCDGDGTLDACQAAEDCNANGVPAACESLTGEGLFAEYYASEGATGRFTRRVAAVVDPVVDFDWGEGSPYGLPVDAFTVSWSGSIVTTDASGLYEFAIQVDDGVRFWIDDQLLIDVWEGNFSTQYAEVELEANRSYTIRLEMFELGGGATCRLSWQPPGQAGGIVPAANLRPYPDADGDGVDDRCSLDCDGDGVSDAAAIAAGAPDCNGNGIPDACDLSSVGVAPSSAWWRFEGAGGTAIDGGPGGFDATLTNVARLGDVPFAEVPLTRDANAGSLGFTNGSRMIVDDPGDLLALPETAMTIEAFVKLDELADTSGNGQRQWLACRKPVGGDQFMDWGVLVQAGNYAESCREVYGGPAIATGRELVFTAGLATGDPTFKWAAVSTLRIDDTEWHHVAVTVDLLQRVVRFVLDGEVEDVALGQRYFPAGSGPLQIGCHVNASGQFNQNLRGTLDELRIFPGLANAARLLSYPSAAVATDTDGDGVPDECVATCDGDLDGSGEVDGADLGLMLVEWGLTGDGLLADLNDDGAVNGADLGLLLVAWGDC